MKNVIIFQVIQLGLYLGQRNPTNTTNSFQSIIMHKYNYECTANKLDIVLVNILLKINYL